MDEMMQNPSPTWVGATTLIAAAALSCPAVFGQAPSIVPQALDGIEGGAGSVIPFGLSGPVRYMCLYDVDQFAFDGPREIHEVRFRADGSTLSFAAKQFLRMDVFVSTTTRRSDDVSTRFEENHGVDKTKVATFISVVLPPQPGIAAGSGPRVADVVIPFDEPFFLGTSPWRGFTEATGLVVDLQITQQPPGTYRLDSPFNCDSQIASAGSNNGNCVTGSGSVPTLTTANDIRAGGGVSWNLAGLPPDGLFVVFLALDLSGFWLTFDSSGAVLPVLAPLPAILHPTAPSCTLFVRPDNVQFSSLADSAGVGQFGFTLPTNRNLVGQRFFAQALVQDITANPFGFIVTDAEEATVCGPLGCARIYNIGNATATTGSVTFGAASIIELR